jgi:membrane-associated progesterone receptor component
MKFTVPLILLSSLCSLITVEGFAFTQRRDQMSPRPNSTNLQMVEPSIIIAAFTIAGAGLVYIAGSEDRQKKKQYSEYEVKSKAIEVERKRKAYIAPKDYWVEEELKQYDGNQDPDGPILFAADGKVFNVYKGRHFYGPGGEYHLFAGRDATRLLAKSKLEEETDEEKTKKLNMGERAALKGWLWTFEGKYDVVGELEGFDESSTSTRTIMDSS